MGRLTEEDYSNWKRTLYTYDAYSNRMKMMVEGKTKDELVSVTCYEYGLNNRLEKETKKQGKITVTYRYRYDDNGNETFRIWEKTAPTPDYPGNVKLSGTDQREAPTVYERRHYDGFNQLIRINQDDKEITYQYRGDGLRHSTQVRKLTESQGKTILYCWDGSNIVAEQVDGGKFKTYLRVINLIAREIDRVVYYYVFNEHGDVTQLWSQIGTCKALYEYDAFGIERKLENEDENPFRYCGEYFDLSSETYYLKSRHYNPSNGRFLTEDMHWNVNNMIYGDNPVKWNMRNADPNDPLGLKIYTYMPDINAIVQNGNLYVYCMNNPIEYLDRTGENVAAASEILKWGWTTGGVVSQLDSPIPGPADVIGVGATLAAGSFLIWNNFTQKPPSLPSWKKVKVNMPHIMSGHSSDGNRGPNKDKFPPGMKEVAILKAIEEAYKHAEKIDKIQYSWQNGVEQVKQLFQGPWENRVIQFWYNFTTKTIETAWPK